MYSVYFRHGDGTKISIQDQEMENLRLHPVTFSKIILRNSDHKFSKILHTKYLSNTCNHIGKGLHVFSVFGFKTAISQMINVWYNIPKVSHRFLF